MTNASSDRLDRIEQALERSTQLLERVIGVQDVLLATQSQLVTVQGQLLTVQEQQNRQIQILLDSATRHDAMIGRLDAILERMIYREGRGSNDDQTQ